MKATTLNFIVTGFLSAFVLSACSKDSSTKSKSNTELLTQSTWKFEIYGLDENNNGIIEASENNMLPCEIDDFYKFNADGTGIFTGGSSQCSPDEPSSINFNWTFSNNGTELAIFGVPEKINSLDENILEVYYMDQNSQGQPVKYIRRFQH
jgi:hypothetical protein